MGAAGSHLAAGGHEELLARFAGAESIAIGDTFWRDLLTFPQQLTRFDPELLQQELAPTLETLSEPYQRRALCNPWPTCSRVHNSLSTSRHQEHVSSCLRRK